MTQESSAAPAPPSASPLYVTQRKTPAPALASSNLRETTTTKLPSPPGLSRRAPSHSDVDADAAPDLSLFSTAAGASAAGAVATPPPPPLPPPLPPSVAAARLGVWQPQRAHLQSPPTLNPHVLARLRLGNPWNRLTECTVEQLAACMQALYVSDRAMSRLVSVSPKVTDVVVCGCVRSGQTGVLRALNQLRGSLSDDLTQATAWIENAESLAGLDTPRLLKTHMTADKVLEAGMHDCKVVVVLRDPVDLRLSWFRHTRRLYRKLAVGPVVDFDSLFTFAAFSKRPMPNLGDFGGNAEHHVALALEAMRSKPAQVCIVFYEDVVDNPLAVVERLAKVTGWGRVRAEKAHKMLSEDVSHPARGKRVGSTQAGAAFLTKELKGEFAHRWEVAMRPVKCNESYAELRARLGVGAPAAGTTTRSKSSLFLLPRKGSQASLSSGGSFTTVSSTEGGKLKSSASFSTGATGLKERGRLGSFSFLSSGRLLAGGADLSDDAAKRKLVDPDDTSEDEADSREGATDLLPTPPPPPPPAALAKNKSGVIVVGKAKGSSGIDHQVVASRRTFIKPSDG